MDYYFKNANLILEGIQGDFAVEKGKMRFHGLKDPDRYDQVTDLQGRIVLKGFCDLHTHLDKALVSSRVENRSGTLNEAIAVMGPYKAGHDGGRYLRPGQGGAFNVLVKGHPVSADPCGRG